MYRAKIAVLFIGKINIFLSDAETNKKTAANGQRLRRLNLILAVPLLLLCHALPLWGFFAYIVVMAVPAEADDIHMKRASKCWFGRPHQYVDYSTFPRP